MTDKIPRITIFLPVFNGEAYIAQTIESLLAQSFSPFELIIVDDGSKDNTLNIAEKYSQTDGRVRIIRGAHSGEVRARNKALNASNPRTDYFLNHDADDLSLPGKLEALVDYLDSHSDISISGTLAEYFNDAGDRVGAPPIETDPDRIRQTFHRVNSMIHSACLIRRVVFETIGGYREEFRSVDDYDLFMRALLAGFKLANVPRVLHRIRLHSHSVGATRAHQQEQLARQIRATYSEYRDKLQSFMLWSPLRLSRLFHEPTQQGAHSICRRTSSLRVLHTVQMYHPHVGGSEEVVKQLSERLVARGHQVTVATGFHPERTYTEWNGVEIQQFQVSGNRVHGIKGDADNYQRFLRNRPFDVMTNYAAQIWSSDLVFPILNEISAAKAFVPCGYSGLFNPAYRAYFEELPRIIGNYDRVVHLSANYRDADFSRRHGLTNSITIGNAASEEEFLGPSESFRRKYNINTAHLIITVANHYHGKGHNHLLNWFRELGRSDVTLAIIGAKIRTAVGASAKKPPEFCQMSDFLKTYLGRT